MFDRGDAPGVRPARDFIVHSGHRGAITPASDLDLDEDGFLDLVFLSLGPSERCGFGLIVAYGSPSGMLRVETQNVEGCLESRGPRAFLGVNPPGLVRLQPLQDASIRGLHLYAAASSGVGHLLTLRASGRRDGGAAWVPSLLAEVQARAMMPAGDLDGDGVGDVVILTQGGGEPFRVAVTDAIGDASSEPRIGLARFPPLPDRPRPQNRLPQDCWPAGDTDGDGRFELACVGSLAPACLGSFVCTEVFTFAWAEGTWTQGRRVVVPGQFPSITAVVDVSGDQAADWVVSSHAWSGRASVLMSSVQAPRPRMDRLFVAVDSPSGMERPPSTFTVADCLSRVIDPSAVAAVGDLDRNGRNDLVVIDRSPCRGVGLKLVRFSLFGDQLRSTSQMLGPLPPRSGDDGFYFVRPPANGADTSMILLGAGPSNLTRLTHAARWRMNPHSDRLDPM